MSCSPTPFDEATGALLAKKASEREPPGDDLTRIVGIGPKLSASLAERGVTRFAQILEWTDADISRLDKELKLMGRIARQDWARQAKTLAR